MQVVPFLPASRLHAGCLVLFADLQLEYTTPGRAYSISSTDDCLDNCRELLGVARKMRLPIAHFRQVRSESHFNRASRFSQWLEEFRPLPSEMVYEREQPSCYSNRDFAAFIDGIAHPTIILAGLSGDQVGLATAVDASQRRDRLIFLSDCSASPALGDLSEAAAHRVVSEIVARFADVLTLREVLAQLNHVPRVTERAV